MVNYLNCKSQEIEIKSHSTKGKTLKKINDFVFLPFALVEKKNGSEFSDHPHRFWL